jgi:hypothetical protein
MLDQEVQGLLIQRVTGYWLTCLTAVAVATWCWQVWTSAEPPSIWHIVASLAPGAIGSLLLLPLVIADVLRASSRFVAPVHNLNNALKRLQLGDEVLELVPRRGDCWTDVTERFNQYIVQQRGESLEASCQTRLF